MIMLLGVTLISGGALWYLVNFGYFQQDTGPRERVLSFPAQGGPPLRLEVTDYEAIAGRSSPLKYRACYRIDSEVLGSLSKLVRYENAIPLIAPSWFTCFDAKSIGSDLEAGKAVAVLVEKELSDGVDSVAAILPDGRVYGWHQLNEKFNR